MSAIGHSFATFGYIVIGFAAMCIGIGVAFALWPFWHVMGGLACLALISGIGAWLFVRGD